MPGIADRVAAFVAAAREQGRDLPVSVFFYGIGPPGAIDDYARAGAQRCVFWLTDAKPETVDRELEVMQDAIRTWSGGA